MRMEIAERQEWTARQGSTLLGTGTRGHPQEHPDQSTKCTATKRKITAGVSPFTLLLLL